MKKKKKHGLLHITFQRILVDVTFGMFEKFERFVGFPLKNRITQIKIPIKNRQMKKTKKKKFKVQKLNMGCHCSSSEECKNIFG